MGRRLLRWLRQKLLNLSIFCSKLNSYRPNRNKSYTDWVSEGHIQVQKGASLLNSCLSNAVHPSLPDGDGVECAARVHVGHAHGPLGEGRVHLPGGAQVGPSLEFWRSRSSRSGGPWFIKKPTFYPCFLVQSGQNGHIVHERRLLRCTDWDLVCPLFRHLKIS